MAKHLTCTKCKAKYREIRMKKNPDYWKDTYTRNKSKRIAASSKYRKDNPLLSRIYNYNSRYDSKITVQFLKDMLASQFRACRICKDRLGLNWHLDHIIPLATGGSSNPSNLQALCQACNVGKYSYSMGEYVNHCRKVARASEGKQGVIISQST